MYFKEIMKRNRMKKKRKLQGTIAIRSVRSTGDAQHKR